MRIAFLGTPAPAVPSLQAFLDAPDVDVAVVITNPDRPAGRGHKLTPPPVKVAALEGGVPVWQPQRPREVLERLRALRVDACAVVAYGSILPQDVLDVGGAGFVNLHFSLLPAWRGAAPVPASILAGEDVTGVTCFRLDAGMDTGDVLTEVRTDIDPDETAGQLTARLAELGAPALVEAVRGLVDGSLPLTPQDHDAATHASKISPDDARLDWSRPAIELHRAVRAFNPMPGAHTTVDGDRLKVHRTTLLDGRSAGPQDGGHELTAEGHQPGDVVGHHEGRPVVATGDGLLRLDQVQPAGRPRMDGLDFANGHQPTGFGS